MSMIGFMENAPGAILSSKFQRKPPQTLSRTASKLQLRLDGTFGEMRDQRF